MTRTTGPDCVVMCNLINTYIHIYIHCTYIGHACPRFFFSLPLNSSNHILKGSGCCSVYSKLPSGIGATHQDNKPILRGGPLTSIDMLATSPAFSSPHVEVACGSSLLHRGLGCVQTQEAVFLARARSQSRRPRAFLRATAIISVAAAAAVGYSGSGGSAPSKR